MATPIPPCPPCCTAPCGSNPTPIPKRLALQILYESSSVLTEIVWDEISHWVWNGDEALCGNLRALGVAMDCTNILGSFALELATFTTQLNAFNNIGYPDYIVVDTDPFTLIWSLNQTGTGISGCPHDDTDMLVIITAPSP